MAEGPTVVPFDYLYIPAEDGAAVATRRFEGTSDDELRDTIRQHFAVVKTSLGQQADFAAALKERSKQHGEVDAQVLTKLAAQDDGNFEIIPVALPRLANGFTATSLYIDDRGRFKDLPVNTRASRLSQRDVRGDAFLLSNHDDPSQDEWRRVDTSMEVYERLSANPGDAAALDTTNQAQMMAAGAMRDGDGALVTEDKLAEAGVAKAKGNAAVGAQCPEDAIGHYNTAIAALTGRHDKLTEPQAAGELQRTCLLNRALCFSRLGRWSSVEADARAVMAFAAAANIQAPPKAVFRLATALAAQKDYDGAREAVVSAEKLGVSAAELEPIREQIVAGAAALKREERAKYSKLFA